MSYLINIKDTEHKDLPLYMSNKLIEAHFSLPLTEQRLLYTYISRLNTNHLELPEIIISTKELAKLAELSDPNYSQVKKAVSKLMDRKLEIETENEWTTFHWFSVARYKRKEGLIRLKMHEELNPYLLGLKKEFTKLINGQVMKFNSEYTPRLYMLCKQYQTIGERYFNIDELRKKLGVEGKYKLYGDLKKRAILPSVNEANELSDIEISFKELKEKRKVTGIIFHINKNSRNEALNIGIEKFMSKSKKDLSERLDFEIKKRWHISLELQEYSKDTVLELLLAIIRGVYDEKRIPKPQLYFKAALDNIQQGDSLY